MVENREVIGVVSSESFSNLYYVIRRLSTHEKAIELLKELNKIVTVGTLSQVSVESALNSGWKDFEDALQHYCAIKEECDAIITRNKKDFEASELPVYSPTEWLDFKT
jgi:predicted nucleic acid-binding protein